MLWTPQPHDPPCAMAADCGLWKSLGTPIINMMASFKARWVFFSSSLPKTSKSHSGLPLEFEGPLGVVIHPYAADKFLINCTSVRATRVDGLFGKVALQSA